MLVYTPPPPHGATAPSGPGPPHYRGLMITLRRTTLGTAPPEKVISLTQTSLPENTQRSEGANIHAFGGVRTHNASKREAADPSLRPRGHWHRPGIHSVGEIVKNGWF